MMLIEEQQGLFIINGEFDLISVYVGGEKKHSKKTCPFLQIKEKSILGVSNEWIKFHL